METLFELQDPYNNSLKDFTMNVDYSLKYLTTDGQEAEVLSGTSTKGSAAYDPATLPAVPTNFRCSKLTTNVQCEFYRVDQTDREIFKPAPTDVRITAQKKKIDAAKKVERIKSKNEVKLQQVTARFGTQA